MSTGHTTDAWVLYPGHEGCNPEPAELVRESFTFPNITEREALVEGLYGCWQGNMTHALKRRPIDVCRARREEKVILGNAGAVRVLKVGAAVTHLREGDVCTLISACDDAHGYMTQALSYDQPGTMGMLAKRAKYDAKCLLPIPRPTRYAVRQWAAYSLRYPTAWSNWKMAYGCYRLQLSEADVSAPHVWGWGGGTTVAELDLARRHGCQVTIISAHQARRQALEQLGFATVDRQRFSSLYFDEKRFASDPAYAAAYRASEQSFLDIVKERTNGAGVDIFLDYIGSPVFRATQKALARQGVVATAGWMLGALTSLNRAIECINRHTYVHTHFARRSEQVPAMQYAEHTGWIPDGDDPIYSWEDIPRLAHDCAMGRIDALFPLFAVNPL